MIRPTTALALLLCLSLLFTSCKREKEVTLVHWDLDQIKERGEINVATLPGSTTYFDYKGEEMGYEYELIQSFCQANGLKLNLTVANNEAKLYELLNSCVVDLIAYNLPLTLEGKEKYSYCGREVITEQVLVQPNKEKAAILTDVTGLLNKDVWVIHDSKHHRRLLNLNDEIGGGIDIHIIEKDTITTEDLIEMVSDGRIPYTISDGSLARLSKTYFSNIDIGLKVSHPQRSSWATRKDMPILTYVVTDWFEKNQHTGLYKARTKRYFELSKMPGDAPAPVLGPGQISHFDDFFKQYAATIDWDWRLLASIAYQESKFYTDRESWAGAIGLMGLMPRTAEAYGISRSEMELPEPSIRAATGLIKTLNRIFSNIEDESDRVRFVLAAYNAGAGHVYDAQALAIKYGKNSHSWNDVEEYLRLMSIPEYYNDPVVKYGYFRSKETLTYVKAVMERWCYYQQKIQ